VSKKHPKSWQVYVNCSACGRKTKTALLPGTNYITGICECGEMWRVSAEVGADGNAIVYQGDIEQEAT
jgi:hypothetical protein